jgi:hypothetical protein
VASQADVVLSSTTEALLQQTRTISPSFSEPSPIRSAAALLRACPGRAYGRLWRHKADVLKASPDAASEGNAGHAKSTFRIYEYMP